MQIRISDRMDNYYNYVMKLRAILRDFISFISF